MGIIQVSGSGLILVEKGVAVLFVYINYRGALETATMGALFTVGQTLTLAFIAAVGIVTAIMDPGRLVNFQPFLPNGRDKLLITMGFTSVALEGFEVIAQTGDEAHEKGLFTMPGKFLGARTWHQKGNGELIFHEFLQELS